MAPFMFGQIALNRILIAIAVFTNSMLRKGNLSVLHGQSVKTFIKYKTAITFNQVASSPTVLSIKSLIAMFVCLIFYVPSTIFHSDFIWDLEKLPFPSHLGKYIIKIGKISIKIHEIGKIEAIF